MSRSREIFSDSATKMTRTPQPWLKHIICSYCKQAALSIDSDSFFFVSANDLDVMLQDMNTVLVQQGIVAASKGLCHACKKPVMGEVSRNLTLTFCYLFIWTLFWGRGYPTKKRTLLFSRRILIKQYL